MTYRSSKTCSLAGRGQRPGNRWLPSLAIAVAALTTAGSHACLAQETIISQEVVGDYVVDGSTYVGDEPSADLTFDASGNCIGRSYGQPDLFYNYYTQGNCNSANAQMYLSPLPVPPNVGHTFFTYQPFYPEEMLYWHKNKFHNYYDNGRGMNRTKAAYYSPPIRQAASNLYWNYLRLPR